MFTDGPEIREHSETVEGSPHCQILLLQALQPTPKPPLRVSDVTAALDLESRNKNISENPDILSPTLKHPRREFRLSTSGTSPVAEVTRTAVSSVGGRTLTLSSGLGVSIIIIIVIIGISIG